jgi:hypothetical protein
LLAVAHQALAVICLDPSIREWLAGADPRALEQADTARVKLREALDRQAAHHDARDGLACGAEATVSDTVAASDTNKPEGDTPTEKLTAAQRATFAVLKTAGRPVRGGKRASKASPVPAVNARAADSLVRLGLAKVSALPYAGVFTSGYEYLLSAEGEHLASAEEAASPQPGRRRRHTSHRKRSS